MCWVRPLCRGPLLVSGTLLTYARAEPWRPPPPKKRAVCGIGPCAPIQAALSSRRRARSAHVSIGPAKRTLALAKQSKIFIEEPLGCFRGLRSLNPWVMQVTRTVTDLRASQIARCRGARSSRAAQALDGLITNLDAKTHCNVHTGTLSAH